jgi:hypothetical protein
MIVTRPKNNREPDILSGFETFKLIVKDLKGNRVAEIPPRGDHWTHDELESLDLFSYSPHGWEAYLGENWIGSSEV